MDTPSAIALRREPGPFTRSLTALTLRVALGLIFITAGQAKLRDRATNDEKTGEPKYPAMITAQYGETILVKGDVKMFADALPYAEIGLGAALAAGILTTLASFLSGALLLTLLFGQTLKGNVPQYPAMLTYLLTNAAVLWLSPVTSNYLSLDGLLFGWFWAPRREGEFVREHEGGVRVKI